MKRMEKHINTYELDNKKQLLLKMRWPFDLQVYHVG